MKYTRNTSQNNVNLIKKINSPPNNRILPIPDSRASDKSAAKLHNIKKNGSTVQQTLCMEKTMTRISCGSILF